MNIEVLGKKVEALINQSVKNTEEYSKVKEDFDTKVSNGLKGPVEAEKQLKEMREKFNWQLSDEAESLKEEIYSFEEQELQRIEETIDTITADQLAELTLLSELELTNGDLDKYIQKYKNNPLALRKLQSISTEKTLMVDIPPSRENVLKSVLGRFVTKINNFNALKTDEVGMIKHRFMAEGSNESIQSDVTYYKSL